MGWLGWDGTIEYCTYGAELPSVSVGLGRGFLSRRPVKPRMGQHSNQAWERVPIIPNTQASKTSKSKHWKRGSGEGRVANHVLCCGCWLTLGRLWRLMVLVSGQVGVGELSSHHHRVSAKTRLLGRNIWPFLVKYGVEDTLPLPGVSGCQMLFLFVCGVVDRGESPPPPPPPSGPRLPPAGAGLGLHLNWVEDTALRVRALIRPSCCRRGVSMTLYVCSRGVLALSWGWNRG